MTEKLTGQKQQLTPKERAEILLSLKNGYTTRQIARTHKVSASTVSRTRKRWQEHRILENKNKTGRSRILNDRLERTAVRLITSRDCSTAVQVRDRLQETENVAVSTPTIRRTLQRNGLVSRIKRSHAIRTMRMVHEKICILPISSHHRYLW